MQNTELSVALYRPAAFNKGGTGVYTSRLIEGFRLASIKGVTPVGGAPGGVLSKFLMEHVSIPERVRKGGFKLLHLPAFGGRPVPGIPFAVTVHDMAFMANPKWFPLLRSLYYRFHFASIAKKASVVISDSEFSSAEIRKYLGLNSSRVYLSAPMNRETGELFRKRYGIHGHYAIYTGTVEPRKNVGNLLRSWSTVRKYRSDLTLVVAGRWGWGNPRTKQLLTETRGVKWVGSLSDKDIRSAVAGAELLVYPSLYEGFGLPPLEAAAAGVPFVLGPAETLKEVYGKTAAAFSGSSSKSIAEAVLKALDRPRRPDDLRAFAEEYSLEAMACNTYSCYESVFR